MELEVEVCDGVVMQFRIGIDSNEEQFVTLGVTGLA